MGLMKMIIAPIAASTSRCNPMPHIVELDPKKVLRQFGPRPELGKAMPCLPKKRVESGFRWANSFGKLKPARHIIDVPRRVALQPAGRNRWRVICDEEHWPVVASWLRANCQ